MTDTPYSDDYAAAIAAIRQATPEPIKEHWVDVDGVLFPPKQAFALLSGKSRIDFNTHHALARLRKLGFATSAYISGSVVSDPRHPEGAGVNHSDGHAAAPLKSARATPGTWRVSDGSAVPFKDAVTAWAEVAHDVLTDTATHYNDIVTYKELSEKVQDIAGIRTRMQMRNWIGRVLGAVVDECALSGKPPLTALCVTQNQTVGEGYRYVLETAGEPIPDDLDHHAAEARLTCYRTYCTNLPADGGVPTLPPQVATARAAAAARKAAASQPEKVELCPEHHLVLPRSGQCAYCD